MLSRSALLAFCLVLSCKSNEPTVELSAAAPLAPEPLVSEASVEPAEAPPSCSEIPECPAGERKSPFQCVAYRYAGKQLWEGQRIYGWGRDLCQAKRALAVAACEAGKNYAELEDLSCAPDPTLGSCPVAQAACPSGGKASRCFAKNYQGSDLTWDQRPMAWGESECKAKQLVLVKACEQGLDPTALGNIRCESDPQPGQCPPPPPSCTSEEKDPTECLLSTLDDRPLKQPWKALGTTSCEAQYRLQELLCRYTETSKPLSMESLGGMECRSLLGQATSSKKDLKPGS